MFNHGEFIDANGRYNLPASVKQTIGPRLMTFLNYPRQVELRREGGLQARRFESLARHFSSAYDSLGRYDIRPFTTPFWRKTARVLELTLLPSPSISFLQNPVVMQTMVISGKRGMWSLELRFLERSFPEDVLSEVLKEDYVGNPLLLRSAYLTSRNNIHHMVHLARFLDKTRCQLDEIETCVEWGGGYGNLAKIFTKLKQEGSTYVIMDLPMISCLQWIYLSSIFGEERVKLITKPEDGIAKGRINILPVCFADRHDIKADLFISTFALSECSTYAQDMVASRSMFGARHVLLAYQDNSGPFPHEERIAELASQFPTVKVDFPLMPRWHYLFA